MAIAVLASSLQGSAVSLGGEFRRVDPHWQRGLSFVQIGLQLLQQAVVPAGRTLLVVGGLDTDPAATPRALHPQSRRAATAEAALVHAD